MDAHIKNLRRKLEVDPLEPRYVLTVFGIGYKFTGRVTNVRPEDSWARRAREFHEHAHHWPPPWRHRRRLLLLRFAAALGCLGLVGLSAMAALAFLLTHTMGGGRSALLVVWIVAVGALLAVPVFAVWVIIRAFRGIVTPLADVMVAADRVAAGDLTTRVDTPRHGPPEFQRLVDSFNRMTEELERADRQRRNLTADVAHELRTPLHIIQGNLEGVLDHVYEPTEEHVRATLDETRLLARLVEDLRTLSLAEAGQLPLVMEPIEVADLLADVETSFRAQAEAAGIDLPCRGPRLAHHHGRRRSARPGARQPDGQRPARTPAGRGRHLPRRVRVARRPHHRQRHRAGHPAEDLLYVFDRFWRGDRSRTHTGGAGSGLGLAIARQLVQAHGGAIHVASQPGRGATFTIDLPA